MKRAKNPAAVALGRLGGSANTTAQNEARRINGKKGGRPYTRTTKELEAEVMRLEAKPWNPRARWALRLAQIKDELADRKWNAPN